MTLMVQLPPASTEAPQLFVAAKSPVAAMLEIRSAALPALVSVTGCEALVMPTRVSGNDKLRGATFTAGASPVKPIVCGLPGASSVMLTAASCVPVPLGVNVILMAQLALARRGTGQLCVSANSEAFTPVRLIIPVMFRFALPVFVKTTVWAAVVTPAEVPVKVRLAGERLTMGITPLPERDTVWGPPAALSLMLRLPVAEPVVVGTKLTLIWQPAPANMEAPQRLVWLNVPVTVMVEMASGAFPLLESATVCARPVPP